MSKLLFSAGDDWTPEILDRAWEEIEIIAREELKVTYYKPQVEIVTARQMLDAYTSVGMPIYYKHWSFGKEFVRDEKAYKSGRMGLAYELVINSDPCIAYLMEENNALIQTLVMAHASVGHSAVFKNNYLFKQYTDASAIIDYLNFAKMYLKKCEEKYGEQEVELVLDACHALQDYGVDRYIKPKRLSPAEEESRALERFERELNDYDHVWEKVGQPLQQRIADNNRVIKPLTKFEMLDEPQENILYFIEKNAPHLPAWKREIIRIVRKLAQYFQPQRATKVVNEGYATFTHFYIMNRLHEKGLIDGGTMIEFFATHNNVIMQYPMTTRFNPYKLGFSIFMEIKRICEGGHETPRGWVPITDEDRRLFPNLIGKNWVEEVNYAMENFKDETFILQYLTPRIVRELQLFAVNDPHLYAEAFEVTAVSDDRGFQDLRQKLAAQHAVENYTPDVQITGIDVKGSRKLMLEHFTKRGRPLDHLDAKLVTRYISNLWEYTVQLKTIEYDEDGNAVPLVITEFGRYSADEPDDDDEEDTI